jgi:hypothetical protein
MIIATSYLAVLLAYAPGIYCLLRFKRCARFPIVVFCFLGLFFFNAVGSILVMIRHYPNLEGSMLSPDYIGILIVQALLFYLISGPYVYIRMRTSQTIRIGNVDTVFIFACMPFILFIIGLYYIEVGTFLIVELINGNINLDNILAHRQLSYGLDNFKYYRLGFLVLPSMLAAHVLLVGAAHKKLKWWHVAILLSCFVHSSLLGEKSGILYIFLVMIIAYSVRLSFEGKGILEMINTKVALGLLGAFVPTVLSYHIYYSTVGKVFRIDTLVFRIFGVYSESIALAVRYANKLGFQSGLTLPTIKGLLKHERFDIETALHVYLSALFKDYRVVTTELKGNIPVSAITEGYVNFGWTGVLVFACVSFLAVIAVQEILLRTRLGILSYTLMIWYAYLALNISMYSIFYTFFSFIHTYVLLGIILLYGMITFILKHCGAEKTLCRIQLQGN